ncbi:hypothetical protein, partial [Candidatus Frankia alpina]|uniref:hypothetical protein n=1 Tax=Candidatus Frankia alpina TaxID=2699483 RepID=UPI001966EC7B
MFFAKRYTVSCSIGFSFVATHNNFAFDRGGKVFKQSAPAIKQSAPAIKLADSAIEEEYLRLLGVLNSS